MYDNVQADASRAAAILVECYGKASAIAHAKRIEQLSVVPEFAVAVTTHTRRLVEEAQAVATNPEK